MGEDGEVEQMARLELIYGLRREMERIRRSLRHRLAVPIAATGEGSRKYFPIPIEGYEAVSAVLGAREILAGFGGGFIDGDGLEEFGLLGQEFDPFRQFDHR